MIRLYSVVKRIKTFIFSVQAKIKVRKFGPNFTVNNRCNFTSRTEVGSNCHFNGLSIQGGGCVKIGNNFHSGSGCIFITSNHNYRGAKLPYDETSITEDIIVEDNVWLGLNVLVMPGITIGEGAIIQAGSVVIKDVKKLAIVGGNPARMFKSRDALHYNELKSKKLFY
ncbi:acyltransferase [Aliivibrio finisterrensis]|uniref:Acyltransferase n=1 Tax=Aliivibrio finisterrensis TaxID=511998 RepID=A0A6N6RNY2_9GAMM|nr:acyltransferase [Aliivibrio finisterrensis]KAB2823162.1 acyltransferase [Aliivibrio finisterrensis]